MRDLSRTVVARITVQPGAQFPWHTHPGPAIVNIARGELVYVPASDCVARPYQAGTAFVDPGHGHVHTAFNRTGGVTVFYATFFEVPAQGPLTITEGVEALASQAVRSPAGAGTRTARRQEGCRLPPRSLRLDSR